MKEGFFCVEVLMLAILVGFMFLLNNFGSAWVWECVCYVPERESHRSRFSVARVDAGMQPRAVPVVVRCRPFRA